MKFSDKLHTALSSLFDSDFATVKSNAKSETTDTSATKTVVATRSLSQGITSITIGTSPLNASVPEGSPIEGQALVDATLAALADEDQDLVVTDGVILNDRAASSPPTGTAVVEDVALGKTFASDAGLDLVGTSTLNATVPIDAPILPPQAFVDNIQSTVVASGASINLPAEGITYFAASLVQSQVDRIGALGAVDLSGNSLSVANINAILAYLVSVIGSLDPGTVDFSDQTPAAAPTGQGITDAATLVTAGWTVTTD